MKQSRVDDFQILLSYLRLWETVASAPAFLPPCLPFHFSNRKNQSEGEVENSYFALLYGCFDGIAKVGIDRRLTNFLVGYPGKWHCSYTRDNLIQNPLIRNLPVKHTTPLTFCYAYLALDFSNGHPPRKFYTLLRRICVLHVHDCNG